MSSPDQQQRVSRRRAALLGAALLTVAVLLWLLLRSAVAPEVSTQPAIEAHSVDRTPRPWAAEPLSVAIPEESSSSDGFNVSVRLQYDSTDALVLSRVREYYEALISGLRAVPKLHLVEDHAVQSSGGPDEFRLTINSLDPLNAQHLRS